MLREQWQRNLAGVLIAAFVSILGFNLVFPFLPLYIKTLGNYDSGDAAFWTGIISLVTGVIGFVSALVWGQMADRRGRKAMLMRATAGPAVGLVVMGLATNIGMLLAGRMMFSALAGTVPAANPLIAANTPPQHIGMAMGMLQSAVFLSNMLGPVTGGALAHLAGYRAAFMMTAALYVAATLPAAVLVRERFVRPTETRPLVASVTSDFGAVMGARHLAIPIVASVLGLCSANVAIPVISLLVRDMVGDSRAEGLAGVVFGVQGLASALSAVAVGRLTSRFGYRRLLSVTAPLSLVVYLLLWVVPGYPGLVALMAVQGLCQGAQNPAYNALIAARAPKARAGAVFGVVTGMNTIAFSGGPFIGGMLARSFGLRAVFPVSALLIAMMATLIGRVTAPAGGEVGLRGDAAPEPTPAP